MELKARSILFLILSKTIQIRNNKSKKLKSMKKGKSFNDVSTLLFEQALLQEGGKLENPSEFVNRLNSVMEKSLR